MMNSNMDAYRKEVLFPAAEVDKKVRELAREIDAYYNGEEILLVCILKGAFIFCADLFRAVNVPAEIEFVRLSGYGEKMECADSVKFLLDVSTDITGKHVLLVDDIVDTGRSIAVLKEKFAARNPKSLKICALVDKKERREIDINIDFWGFSLKKGFVVGYGMDFAEKYRRRRDLSLLVKNGD